MRRMLSKCLTPFEGDTQNYKIAVSLLIAGYSFERKRAMRATPPKKKCVWQCGVFKCDALNNQTCKLHLMFSCVVSDVLNANMSKTCIRKCA